MDDQLQRQPDYYDWLKKGCEKAEEIISGTENKEKSSNSNAA